MPTTAPTTFQIQHEVSAWDIVTAIANGVVMVWNAFPWWGKILVVVAIIWRISVDVRKR